MSTNIGSPSGLRYVSVCAGIEAATAAWHSLGWTPVLFSEIEPFPRAVLQHHYPDVPLIGDFTQMLPTADGPAIIPPPEADLLVGGTPCQAFSVAGKRLSLEDYRGNLSLAFADLFHAGGYEYALWENVPGVLSTKDNAFGCLLGRLVGADGPLVSGRRGGRWTGAGVVSGPEATAAWRILDAQYYGVAQRRRRVFVLVGRGARGRAVAPTLLPLLDGVLGDPPPRRETWQGAPGAAPACAGSRGVSGVAHTLPARTKGGGGMGTDFDCDGGLVGYVPEVSPSLKARDYKGVSSDGDGDGAPLVVSATGPITHALKAEGADGSEDGTGRGVPIVAQEPVVMRQREGKPGGGKGPLLSTGLSLTNRQDPVVSGDLSQPLGAKDNGMGVLAVRTAQTSAAGSIRPRRLTPVECERLQGFPDTWTMIPLGVNKKGVGKWRTLPGEAEARYLERHGAVVAYREGKKGKPGKWVTNVVPDGPRYKALGNSMAVPCMLWLGMRLDFALRLSFSDGEWRWPPALVRVTTALR